MCYKIWYQGGEAAFFLFQISSLFLTNEFLKKIFSKYEEWSRVTCLLADEINDWWRLGEEMARLTFLSLSIEGTQRQTACFILVKSMWLAGQGTGQGVRKSGLYSQLWHWLMGWSWPVAAPSMPVSRKQGFNDNPQKGMLEQFLGIWGLILWGLRQAKMIRSPGWIFLYREGWLRAFRND